MYIYCYIIIFWTRISSIIFIFQFPPIHIQLNKYILFLATVEATYLFATNFIMSLIICDKFKYVAECIGRNWRISIMKRILIHHFYSDNINDQNKNTSTHKYTYIYTKKKKKYIIGGFFWGGGGVEVFRIYLWKRIKNKKTQQIGRTLTLLYDMRSIS